MDGMDAEVNTVKEEIRKADGKVITVAQKVDELSDIEKGKVTLAEKIIAKIGPCVAEK